MVGVALSLVSAALFGAMSVSLGFAIRGSRDAEAGALVTALIGLLVCSAGAVATLDWDGDLLAQISLGERGRRGPVGEPWVPPR